MLCLNSIVIVFFYFINVLAFVCFLHAKLSTLSHKRTAEEMKRVLDADNSGDRFEATHTTQPPPQKRTRVSSSQKDLHSNSNQNQSSYNCFLQV